VTATGASRRPIGDVFFCSGFCPSFPAPPALLAAFRREDVERGDDRCGGRGVGDEGAEEDPQAVRRLQQMGAGDDLRIPRQRHGEVARGAGRYNSRSPFPSR
jgi:hypothetical protein